MSLNTSRNQDDEKAEIEILGSGTDDFDDSDLNDNNNNNNNNSSGSESDDDGNKEEKSSNNKKVGSGLDSRSVIEYAWRIQLDLRRVGKHRGNVYNRIRKILNYYGFERYSSNGNGPIYYRNDDIIDHYSNRNDIKDEFIIPTLFSQLMIRKIQTEIDGINQEALKKLIENEKEKEKEKEKGNGNKGSKNKKNDSKKEEDISRKIEENFEKTMLVRYQIFYHGHYGDLSISWTAPIGNHYLKKIENNARDGTACQQNDCHNNNNNNNNNNNDDSSGSSDSDSKPRKKNKDDSSKTKTWKTSMVGGGDYSASDEEALSEESVSDMGSNDEYDSHDDMHPEMSNLKRKHSMCKDNNNNNSINNNSNKNMKSSKNSKKTDINKKDNVKNILNTTNQNKKNGDINNNELDELSSEFSSATATDNDNDEDDTGVDSVKKQLSFRKRN